MFEKYKNQILAVAIVVAIIIIFFVIKVNPINFNDMYPGLDDEYWCQIASDGSWLKIEATSYSHAAWQKISNINEELGFSSAVYEDMMGTRALDGRLTAESKKAKLSWRFDGTTLAVIYETNGKGSTIAESVLNKYGSAVSIVVIGLIICSCIGFFLLKPDRNVQAENNNNEIAISNPQDRPKNGNWVPVYSTIEKEIPTYNANDTNIIDYEDITDEMASLGNVVGFRISDDNMSPRISKGDVVIFVCDNKITDGDLVIISVESENAVCREIKKTPVGIYLMSSHSNCEPIFYSNKEIKELPVRILGKVIELRAKF